MKSRLKPELYMWTHRASCERQVALTDQSFKQHAQVTYSVMSHRSGTARVLLPTVAD